MHRVPLRIPRPSTLGTLATAGLLILAGCAESPPTAPLTLLDPGADAPRLDAHDPAAPSTVFSVMSRNLYLGGDISLLLAGGDLEEVAGIIWDQIQLTDYPARSARLAEEILAAGADMVGLQEVTRFTVLIPGAEPQTLDFLQVLLAQLALRGTPYEAVAQHRGTQVTVPIRFGEVQGAVTYEDGQAILVRAGLPVRNAANGRFAASPPPSFTAGVSFFRGWTSVEVGVSGRWMRVMNTHLEVQEFAPWQEAQTAELLALANASELPTLLVGDFNSAANPSAPADRKTGSYGQILAAGFQDLWLLRGRSADEGLTCCHDPSLDNPGAAFDQRIDFIFARNLPNRAGFAGDARLAVTGADPEDRFTGSFGQPLWPSDHGGLRADLRLPVGLLAAP
jgi:endonuclease/exonuclease/phosphatase family metal-dependent hydrolase